jgi:hypothetical protein
LYRSGLSTTNRIRWPSFTIHFGLAEQQFKNAILQGERTTEFDGIDAVLLHPLKALDATTK